MAASGWHPAHFTQKTCSFQVKTGLLHPLILKQMRQPLPLSIYLYMFLYVIGIGRYLINQNSLPAVPPSVEVCTVNFVIKEDFVIHR